MPNIVLVLVYFKQICVITLFLHISVSQDYKFVFVLVSSLFIGTVVSR